MNTQNKIKTIWITYGLPAAGKDTWANSEMRKCPGKYKKVSKDLLRLMLDDDVFSFENEKFVLKIRDIIVESALNQGYDVIVCDTNFPVGGKHFKRMCEIAKKIGNVRVVEKYFDVSLEEALSRNFNSDRKPVPEDVIRKMYEKYIKNKSFTCQDVFFEKVEKIPYNNALPDCIIFDVDGTLAHMNGKRMPFDWYNVDKDDPDEYIIKLANMIAKSRTSNTKLFIISGRDGIALEKTKKWLNDFGIVYDDIFIRKAGDTRKDYIIKKEIYEKEIKGKYNVIAIFDDRDQVVEMWRSIGLTVCQVAYGNF